MATVATGTSAVPGSPPAETKTTPRIDRRPKDSMKSTWRTGSKKDWNIFHWLLHILNLYPQSLDRKVPVFKKDDPIPVFDVVRCHIWLLNHSLLPIVIQWCWQQYTGKPWTATTAFLVYSLFMQLNAIRSIWILRGFGHEIGFLDGDKHARDEVPDIGVAKTVVSLLSTVTFRPLIAVIFSYKVTKDIQINPYSFVFEQLFYSVILDFFFYIYHRSCHELDGLWKYHRTHHLTKHPNVLLSSYADEEQEFLELGLIPLLAWATLRYVFQCPMGFHSWWIAHEYVILVEAFGHSGLRMYSTTVSFLSPFLIKLGMDLHLEDHDLHHRKGWRKSSNYGKQTRVWDTLFGTCGPRIESVEANVDWNHKVKMPYF